MQVGFFHSTKTWCVELAELFKRGAHKHGDVVEPVDLDAGFSPHWDAACILGIGYQSTWDRVQRAPVPMIYLDKGFTRTGDYNYASIGTYRPVNYVGAWGKPDDRRKKFGWNPQTWRKPKGDGTILIAGSSYKFHTFHRLPTPKQWVETLVQDIRRFSPRPIVYRIKPNQPTTGPIAGVTLSSGGPISKDLENCHVVIVHGSSVALDALLVGIPAIVLGTAITLPISSAGIEQVETPRLASMTERLQFLNDLAYCQWSNAEYESGVAWAHIKPELLKLCKTSTK